LFLESLQKFSKAFFSPKKTAACNQPFVIVQNFAKRKRKKLRLRLLQGFLFEYFAKKFTKKSMDFGLGSPDLERLICRSPNITSIRKQFDYPAVAQSGYFLLWMVVSVARPQK